MIPTTRTIHRGEPKKDCGGNFSWVAPSLVAEQWFNHCSFPRYQENEPHSCDVCLEDTCLTCPRILKEIWILNVAYGEYLELIPETYLHRGAMESSLLWNPKAVSCISVYRLLIPGLSSAHLCRNTSSLYTSPCKSLLVEGFSSLIVSHELLHKQLTEE